MNHRHGIALGLSLLMAANMCAPVRVSDYSVQVSIPGTSVTAPFSIIAKTLSLSVSSSETGGTVYTVTPETPGEYTIELPKDSGADSFRILFKDPETGEVVEATTVYSSGISVYLGQHRTIRAAALCGNFAP